MKKIRALEKKYNTEKNKYLKFKQQLQNAPTQVKRDKYKKKEKEHGDKLVLHLKEIKKIVKQHFREYLHEVSQSDCQNQEEDAAEEAAEEAAVNDATLSLQNPENDDSDDMSEITTV